MPEQKTVSAAVTHEIDALCASSAAVDEFLSKNASKIDVAAAAITRQLFGYNDDVFATEISEKSMVVLIRACADNSLPQRIRRAPSVLSWLRGVMKMTAYDVRRGQFWNRTHVQIEDSLLELADEHAASSLERLDSPVVERHIQDCFKMLSDSQRRVWSVISAHGGDRPSSREISAILGISVGSVDVHYANGRERLEKCLQSKGVTP